MIPTPKHREISRQLLAEIGMGKYGAGGRLPSETQLVQRFGVSRPTIGRALRDLQAEGLIERRAGSGTYVRNQTPQSSTRQLGLLVPALGTTEVFELICGELASLARANDYALLWGAALQPKQDENLSPKTALAVCDQFLERRVMGVFFTPFDLSQEQDETNRIIAERLRKGGIPVVLLDRDLTPFPERTPFDLVGIDNFAAGYMVAEHLLKLGPRRLSFVMGPSPAPSLQARLAGVREAMARHQIETPPAWIQTGDPEDPKFIRLLTAGARWNAFICANDLLAAQLLRGLEKIRVRVPRDVRVVGFDDVKYATLPGVPLTTIHQPAGDIALTAFRAMMERITEPSVPARSLLVTPHLVVRESCGAYLARRSDLKMFDRR
jgi:LacI family transcriptional regulator